MCLDLNQRTRGQCHRSVSCVLRSLTRRAVNISDVAVFRFLRVYIDQGDRLAGNPALCTLPFVSHYEVLLLRGRCGCLYVRTVAGLHASRLWCHVAGW
jgi:hypothetical protein